MKKTILISSLIIIAVLFAQAYRENLNMDWQKYQRMYKSELKRLATSPKEKALADAYKIKHRQIVLPELNRFDRCVSCHVGIENPKMANFSQPLKKHPGNYLEIHEIEKVGCTICHDGQGRAITNKEAKAHGEDMFWEKPLLMKPFIESNCFRCHQNELAQTPHHNKGKETFDKLGCVSCHKVNGKGGIQGPDLSNVGNANFHLKTPSAKNRTHLLEKFQHNPNLAYLYESVKEPNAQGATVMPVFNLSEDELIELVVYLKSLSLEHIAHSILAPLPDTHEIVEKTPEILEVVPVIPVEVAPVAVSSDSVKEADKVASGELGVYEGTGQGVFQKFCSSCHTVGQGRLVGPDLINIHERRSEDWIIRFVKSSQTLVKQGDPQAVAIFNEFYKTIMPDLKLSNAEIQDVLGFIKHISAGGTAKTTGGAQAAVIEIVPLEDVTQQDISRGRDIFQGKVSLVNGGPACNSCHNVQSNDLIAGGSLAKELTTVFARMGAPGIKAILKSSPFPVMQKAYEGNNALTEEEIFSLTAFLQKANEESGDQVPGRYGIRMFLGGILGMFVLLGLYAFKWNYRKIESVNQDRL